MKLRIRRKGKDAKGRTRYILERLDGSKIESMALDLHYLYHILRDKRGHEMCPNSKEEIET